MSLPTEITTARLRLRGFLPTDLAPFARLNADPRVMRHLSAPLSREESDATAARIQAHLDKHGFTFWAAELTSSATFVGFIGLVVPRIEAHFTPCVEVGWRLAFEHWGNGYATEGALAAMNFGFESLKLPEIVAYTVPQNRRSRRVMEKLGMTHDPADDFDYPDTPEGDPLRRHVLYRRSASGVAANRALTYPS